MNALPFGCLLAAQFCQPLVRQLMHRRSVRCGVDRRFGGPRFLSTRHTRTASALTRSSPGASGGVARFQRQFWGGASRQLLAQINEEAKQGAVIFWDRTNEDAFKAYQREGSTERPPLHPRTSAERIGGLRFIGHSDWISSAVRGRSDSTLVAVESLEGTDGEPLQEGGS